MNWKKIGLFILFFVIGVVVFGISIYGLASWISPIFFIAYIVLLIFIIKEFSRKKLIIISALVMVYILIMLISFPKCYSESSWSGIKQDCTCIGLEKHSIFTNDYYWSECVGIPVNYHCVKRTVDGEEKISCE
jgi:hypothetical protein